MAACFLKFTASEYTQCSSVGFAKRRFHRAARNGQVRSATIHLALDKPAAYSLSIGPKGGVICKKELI